MALKDFVPYGSDVSAGSYECADCGRKYSNRSKTSMPPCPNLDRLPHHRVSWRILSEQGDALSDPYPK
ncbi:hypothetical protein DCO48_20810 [Pseudomonas sp. SDI]|uniref:hypothetical protein n=1 Tax=Pseudomonas sp. SDI TaxID=2170734 RepID=UPI000DE6A75E|nr:hypothetical protein [Pseudomonas sp. SDI]PWB30297.1 hypothetical protein DCO48_20810 [Pseudomonas sp. SDI]